MEAGIRWSRGEHGQRRGSSGRRMDPLRCEKRRDRQRDYDRRRPCDRPRERVDNHRHRDSLQRGSKRRYSDRNEDEYEIAYRDQDNLMTEKEESRSILLTNLPSQVTLREIRTALRQLEGPQPVNIIFRQRTGSTRCFAIVEFYDLQGSTRWMETNQEKLVIHGKSIQVNYNKIKLCCANWFCKYCGVENLGKKWSCYKCGVKKSESPDPQQLSEIKPDTLMLSNISSQTNVYGILFMLTPYATLCTSNIKLFKDKDTGMNKGYAFIKLSSPLEASQLLTILCGQPLLQLDGEKLSVGYAKTNVGELPISRVDLPEGAPESAAGPGSTAAQLSSGQLQQGAVATSSSVAPPEVCAHKPVTAGLHEQQTASVCSTSQVTPPSSNNSNPTAVVSAAPTTFPDPSKYKYDESTGYYYDSQAGLYYDPSSQFYYNSETQQYLYWDSEKQTHIPVQPESDTPGKEPKEKKKKCKNKTPQQIVKEMERWTKMQNQQKRQQRENKSRSQCLDPPKNEQSKDPPATDADADADFSQFERKREDYEMMCLVIQQFRQAGPEIFKSDLVDASNTDGDPEEGCSVRAVENEGRGTDWMGLVCLVCQRQFPTKDTLLRHQQFSDLHKQNLETQRNATFPEAELERRETELSYGARERRDEYGVSEPPPPQREFDQSPPATINYKQHIEDGLARDTEDRILDAMGWQEGRGLGRHYQDITALNSASLNSTGLRVEGGSYELSPSDTDRDAAHQDMFVRFTRYT